MWIKTRRVSNLEFYAQSTIMDIPGDFTFCWHTIIVKNIFRFSKTVLRCGCNTNWKPFLIYIYINALWSQSRDKKRDKWTERLSVQTACIYHVFSQKGVGEDKKRDRWTDRLSVQTACIYLVFSQEGVSSPSHHHVLVTLQCAANRTIVSAQIQHTTVAFQSLMVKLSREQW